MGYFRLIQAVSAEKISCPLKSKSETSTISYSASTNRFEESSSSYWTSKVDFVDKVLDRQVSLGIHALSLPDSTQQNRL